MREDLERHLRSVPGESYCFACSKPFPSTFDCAAHIEEKHPEVWLKATVVAERIDRIHEKMAQIQAEMDSLQKQIELEITSFRKIVSEMLNLEGRN